MMDLTVTPLPSIGEVVSGRDAAGRELRISGHPERDRVVLSIWDHGRCLATVRLARADVPEVTRALVATLTAIPQPAEVERATPARVHRLHPVAADGRQAAAGPPGGAAGSAGRSTRSAGRAVRARIDGVSDWIAVLASSGLRGRRRRR